MEYTLNSIREREGERERGGEREREREGERGREGEGSIINNHKFLVHV